MNEGVVAERGAMTIASAVRQLAGRLRSGWGGRDDDGTPGLDARMLLGHALTLQVADLSLRQDDEVPVAALVRAERMIDRRLRGEPVARIIGTKEFWSLDFRLSPGTLVPRPDTETLVEATLRRIDAEGQRDAPLRLLDLGTGSGCILLALLSELPKATGIGTDCSPDAVATATSNAARLGLSDRADFVAGDWAEGIDGPFDVVVSNPPYIETADLPDLPVEVIGHDPSLALDGGEDGLDPYRAILPEIPGLLAKGGFAVVEYGPRQSEPIAALARSVGLGAATGCDLGGRERIALLTMLKESP